MCNLFFQRGFIGGQSAELFFQLVILYGCVFILTGQLICKFLFFCFGVFQFLLSIGQAAGDFRQISIFVIQQRRIFLCLRFICCQLCNLFFQRRFIRRQGGELFFQLCALFVTVSITGRNLCRQRLFFGIALFQLLFQRIQLLNHFRHIGILTAQLRDTFFSLCLLFGQPDDLPGQRRFICGQCGQIFLQLRILLLVIGGFLQQFKRNNLFFRCTCFQLFFQLCNLCGGFLYFRCFRIQQLGIFG